MIKSKEDLSRTLRIEKELYFENKYLSRVFACSKNYIIWKWQKYLRYEEYYHNCGRNFIDKCLFFLFKRKKNKLGIRIGFDVPINCFDEGLIIHHVSPITVNENARVGKNCDISGNVCIGAKNNCSPTIGDNIRLGYGCAVIGNVTLGNNITVGAGAVVLKSFEDGAVLVGIPAVNIEKS